MSELLQALLKPDKPGFDPLTPLPARLTESPFSQAEDLAADAGLLHHLDGLASKLTRAAVMRDQAMSNIEQLERELGELGDAFAENIRSAQGNLRKVAALISEINK